MNNLLKEKINNHYPRRKDFLGPTSSLSIHVQCKRPKLNFIFSRGPALITHLIKINFLAVSAIFLEMQ